MVNNPPGSASYLSVLPVTHVFGLEDGLEIRCLRVLSIPVIEKQIYRPMCRSFVDHKHNLTLAGEEKVVFLFLV